MTQPRRILFLFNHDAAHQAAHVAGIMADFAIANPDVETIAATGTPAVEQQLHRLIGVEAAAAITWIDLTLSPLTQSLLAIPNQILPAQRLARLRAHEDLFASVDMVVSPERTCLRVKDRLLAKRGKAPPFVFVPHGAGDRSVTYHPSMAGFDHFLVSGQKVCDEMEKHGIARPGQCRIIGYAKFDAVGKDRPRLFDNDLPTILYNPHFDPHLSSWYDEGPRLLELLSAMGDRFNTVFAPHVMLWRKRLHISPEYRTFRMRPDVPTGLAEQENVLVDTASPALFDMTYTTATDIYIGDVSSQVYEFLRQPKPCIFIDAAAQGSDAYQFWENGPVVRRADEVVALLDDWQALKQEYRQTQERLFQYTIDHDPELSASARGAKALADILR
ncbi:hypothetical protein [Qipengyuania sp. 483]